MSHEFTSGCFGFNQPAWHGLGEVISGTLPAEEMFRRAEALFPVKELQLWGGNALDESFIDGILKATDPGTTSHQPAGLQAIQRRAAIRSAINQHLTCLKDNRIGIWRPDQKRILGTASPGYQIIPNQRLLDFANALREEVDMDTVIVLRGGAKVAFTAKIRGAAGEIVPGDKIGLNYVGYLGHDGKTALGAMLTPTRVVCENTLGYAMDDADRSGKHLRIRHNAFEIGQIDSLIEQIDLSRQRLPQLVDEMQLLQSKQISYDGFRHYLERAYTLPPVTLTNGDTRPASVLDMPRKWQALEQAWTQGLGSDIPGVEGTAWAAFNAITEVESSTKTAGSGRRRLHSALFGNGRTVIQRARELALAL